MLVSDLRLLTPDGYRELRANMHSQLLAEPFVLWSRFALAYQRFLNIENGNPFVSALLVLSMRGGEPLAIPVPVSARAARHHLRCRATAAGLVPGWRVRPA